ncbi:MAG: hypothetical protein ACKOFW_06960 [Planctomycetaceae bacterium]
MAAIIVGISLIIAAAILG